MQFGIERVTIPHKPQSTAATHWVCFSCKKMYKKRPTVLASVCPQCTSPMMDMGRYFEPPPMADARLWVRLERLADKGFRFYSTAMRDLVFGPMRDSRKPSARTATARIDVLLERGHRGLLSMLSPETRLPSNRRPRRLLPD